MKIDLSQVNPYRKSKLKPFDNKKDPDAPPSVMDIRERYAWNTHILQQINKGLVAQEFILPVICGYFEAKVIELQNKVFHVGILSRRSRFNAGPRFLRRGIDSQGNPANEVETEFFVYEMVSLQSRLKKFCSYIFYRGSAPFFWGHTNIGYSPKPDIVLYEDKDASFSVTDKHFERLIKTFGGPIKILSLVKKESKNERKLGYVYEKYMKAIDVTPRKFLKSKVELTVEWFDFFSLYNVDEAQLLSHMQTMAGVYVKDVRPTFLDFSLDGFGVN
jgi:hypothetical protein